jgi:hypothetical protein
MARKRTRRTSTPAAADRTAVTAERFTRLARLLRLLAETPQTRQALARRLRIDVRGFYRDLELLRGAGVQVALSEGRYALTGPLKDALDLLPFPDPHLTLGEARQLARGRGPANRRIKEQVDRLVS